MNAAYEHYLKSPHWKSLRARKLKFSGYCCNRCRSTDNIQVHHVYYRRSWYDCDLCDLEVLCEACHEKAHHIRKEKFKRARARNVLAFSPGNMSRNVCGRY